MKLSDMRELLAAEGIQLTKSLGQNFLHDANQLQRIVKLADLSKKDQVLEIGPGLGPLTELLLKSAGKVLAIEKDRRLVTLLQKRFRDYPNLELVAADALEELRASSRDWSEWKVVSNLPYSVGSPLLVELTRAPLPPALMVVTLQLEVVRRLLAQAGDADYGLLTVLVRITYEPADWFKIPASCFFPEPDVDSGTIKLARRSPPVLPQELAETFTRIVKQGFSQRRKMMLKLLKERWPEGLLRKAFREVGLAEDARAETVTPEDFARLSALLHGNSVG
jgi:16S rRNA (adenine1518-N6/adenine1519-N6)-dimethyltransferase